MPAISDIDDSEASFLEAMRENDDDLTLTISRNNGHWIVAMVLPGMVIGLPSRILCMRR